MKINIDTLSIPGAFLVHLWYKTFLRQDWARGGAKLSSNRHIPQAIYTFHKVYSIRYNTIQCNNERSSCAFLVWHDVGISRAKMLAKGKGSDFSARPYD